MDQRYSYFVHKPKVSWSNLRAEFRPRVEACSSREEFVWELIQMLSRLEDMHIWLEVDGETIGTYQKPWQRTWNSEAIGKQLAESRTLGDFAQIGTTKEGGYGYLAVFQLKAQPVQVDQLLKELDVRREAPGFVVDLRMCSGGSEPIAQRIAGWFSAKEVVYAQHAYRNGPQHDEFGPRQSRRLLAAETPYQRPVVCLTGPRTMSSAEAFVLMMKTLPHATTVGAATRGASGNPQPVELPGVNVKVWYSRWVAMDAAGKVFEGTGIAPDVAVDGVADAHLQDDPTFARALATLRSRINRNRP
jgi:C-terminal processing protease CtpA/Prc